MLRTLVLTSMLLGGGACVATALPAQEDARAASGASVTAAAVAEIEEWNVPWPDSRPRDPSVAPDGRVWFVGQADNYLAVFDPDDASFKRFDLPSHTRPHTVLVDAQGRPWVAGNGNGTILRFDAEGRLEQRWDVPATPDLARRDPHTFAFDGRGGLWFTMQQGNAIGHLGAASGEIRVARVPTGQARPYGIVATPEGDAVAVLFGGGKLARVSHSDMAIEEIPLPRERSLPRRLGLHDGVVWYVDFAGGFLGRHVLDTGATEEWKLPSEPSAPYAMGLDGSGRPWIFETAPQPNLLRRFDPGTKRFSSGVPIPSGGASVRHMEYDAERNSFWFGTDANTIGQARLGD